MSVAKGAAVEYIEKVFGGRFEENDSTISVGTSATKVVDNDPDALALTIVNIGANSVYLAPTNNPTSSKGIILDASGGSVSMVVRDDLLLPALEWYGIAPSGASNVYVIRLRRYRLPAQAPPAP